MRDTTAEVERHYRQMLLKRSGAERLAMGCSMHAMARELIVASVLEKEPGASPVVLRRALFLRFYGREFDPETCERILARLSEDSDPGT
jgi:hypothetical protein